ncbi:hypothetical protein M422DRAFT_243873 [Sphaerobolus stellatus SS14]|nr:hypothetical protein M422DRAFT_243873 [Sphaerobolus stellatus SS14]
MSTFPHGPPLIYGIPPPPPPPPFPTGAIVEGTLHLHAVAYLDVGACAMLVYDHLLTLDQEVNRIWKRPFSGASLLFLLNRYLSPLQAIIGMIWILTPIISNHGSLFTFLSMGGCVRSSSGCYFSAYSHDPGGGMRWFIHGCSPRPQIPQDAFKRAMGLYGVCHSIAIILFYAQPHNLFQAPLWMMPMIYDAIIFLLTIWATQMHPKAFRGKRAPIIERFRKDGMLYFLCIFGVNLMNTLFYLHASATLKTTGTGYYFSSFASSFAVITSFFQIDPGIDHYHDFTFGSEFKRFEPRNIHIGRNPYIAPRGRISFYQTVVGNLGEELEDDHEDGYEGEEPMEMKYLTHHTDSSE